MTIAPEAPATTASLRFLSMELTGRCQFTCPSICYAKSSPTGTHGTMSDEDWLRTVGQAVALGVEEVQLIGGEPTLHPGFVRIARGVVDAGLRLRVYTNLFRVREEHWDLFADPKVRLATTYHSTVSAEHDAATGRKGSHRAARANIVETLRRGIALTVSVLDAGDHEGAERARAEMKGLGVQEIHVGKVRAVGNAAGAALPSTSALCGRCGDQRATVLPNGDVSVCEIGRFLTAGNVQGGSLETVLASPRWAEATASIPRRTGLKPCAPDCEPASSDSCAPAKGNPCGPMEFTPAS
ncbi:radical SAM/SPASM domain-containing protein [[Kitasatospora] papulosa]|uniref:radical SAM/SPASM domain-containing protein n=1 Tax=[Kitasatospora] papulosa TaxID=1464011 RepID=UPI003690BAF1